MPGLPVGAFAIRPGPMMASSDVFEIRIEGRGAHAAKPQLSIDPVLVGSHLVTALQSIVSRTVDPLAAAVVSVTQFHAGDANNIIPETAELAGTIRTLDPGVRLAVEERFRAVVAATGQLFGARIDLTFTRGYPVTVNDAAATRFAAETARLIVDPAAVDEAADPMMGAEDFSYLLEKRPGAYIFLGNGDTAGLHNPAYDFADEAIPYGASFWVALAERALAR